MGITVPLDFGNDAVISLFGPFGFLAGLETWTFCVF